MAESEQHLLVRFFKLGSLLSLVGSIHILTLLLPWYVVKADTVSRTVVSGYLLRETLILSAVGGVLAGVSLIATSFSSRAGMVRAVLSALAILGGLVALSSPMYLNFVIIPRLSVAGEPDLGFFASILSAIALIALGLVVVLTRPRRAVMPYPGYFGMGEAAEPAAPAEQTTMEPVESVDEGVICPICYTSVTTENAVRCSSCGIVFHQGCAEAYININGTCPNCNRAVV
ncbi:MAG: RING-H2 finger protein [Candidatus Caldarchaeum sp.]|uniref:RING-type domain-containing protein n=1 Tax=Caldiarchaeum subterraneum TaxID=311458 RepID=A0A7C5LA92_CALS0